MKKNLTVSRLFLPITKNFLEIGRALFNHRSIASRLQILRMIFLPMLISVSMVSATPLWAKNTSTLFDEQRGVLTIEPVIKKTSPAVVNISVSGLRPTDDNPLLRDPLFRKFFNIPDQLPQQEVVSAGSGVIVNAAKGYVLTNYHVVANAKKIMVRLKDGRRIKATFLGSDKATDIALIKISAKKLVAIKMGNSDKLRVGDFVIAIGNPFGLSHTVTSGIVSALGRGGLSRDRYEDFIQTDAPINPGNSGGALINTKGELVGINTAIIAPSGGSVGIGFAIPVNMARAVMSQLISYGRVERGRIGVSVQDITPDVAKELQLTSRSGAVIRQLERASPAEKAGLKVGDAIVGIDGIPLKNGNHLRNYVGLLKRGTKVELSVIRDEKRQFFTVLVDGIR